MEVKTFTNKRNHTIYFLVDDDGKVIKPVYDYMLYVVRNDKKLNTVKNICYNLKLYFDWLSLKGLDYKSAVAKKSKDNEGIMANLSAFKMWLKYPAYDEKIVELKEMEAKRVNSTINQIMGSVFGFYDFLVINGDINEFPMYAQLKDNSQFRGMLSEMALKKENKRKSLLKSRVPKKLPKYITKEEYEKMYAAAENTRDKILLALMYDGGLRVSEVIGLHIEDLNEIYLNKIKIVAREDIENPDAAVKYESIGQVFISDQTRDLIIQYINEYLSYVDTDYFLFNIYGETKFNPMHRSNIEKIVARLSKKAKLGKKVTPHMLRHGCAVFMLKNGCTMKQIQDKLRHRSPLTTATIYAELDEDGRKEAMKTAYDKANTPFNPDDMRLDDIVDWLIDDEE